MAKMGNIIKTQIGIIIMVIFVGSALGYAFFGRSTSKQSIEQGTQEVSCGITPNPGTSGCALTGTTESKIIQTSILTTVETDPQAQVITMNYDESGLSPATVNVEVGKAYTISINVTTDVYGCMNSIYIPGLDDNIQSVRKGVLTFNIKPTKAGTYEFDCAMGVPHGAQIIVK